MSRSESDRFLPVAITMPSRISRLRAGTSSISAAVEIAFSRTAFAARWTELPAVTVWRLAKPPRPSWMVDVSPLTTVMSSGRTLSWSAAICARIVFSPCPIAIAPV